MQKMFLSIVPWPAVKAAIDAGAKGYYIQRDGFVTVVLPDNLIETEFPDAATWDTLPQQLQAMMGKGWAEEFQAGYAEKLIRSERLSDPATR